MRGTLSFLIAPRAALLASALIAVLCCGACSTTAGLEATGKKGWDQEGAPELIKHLSISGSALAGSLEIVDLKHATVGGLMKAQVSVRSRERETQAIQYKFDWYDANGMEVAANAAWKPLLVHAAEFKTIQGVAPDPRAQEFRVKIRDGDAQ